MIEVLDLDAPILPGVGLGRFEVGSNIGVYRELFRTAEMTMGLENWCRLWGFEATYAFPALYELEESESHAWLDELDSWMAARKEGHHVELPEPPKVSHHPTVIEVVVDVRDGVIAGVSALAGYRGALLDKIRLGMTYSQVRQCVPAMHWSWTTGQAVEGIDGVVLHFDGDEIDVPEDERQDLPLTQIDVFSPDQDSGGHIGL